MNHRALPLINLALTATVAFGGVASYANGTQAANASGSRCLIVGGGPSKSYNQVAIESNVRYLQKLLAVHHHFSRTLFADGNKQHATVLYEDARGRERYRKPRITTIDGPAKFATFQNTLRKLGSLPTAPLLLYFTGHGGPDEDSDYANNDYGLWHDDPLTVTDLSEALDAVKPERPIVLVMVQCYSGAFANLVFDLSGSRFRPNICGFFASVPTQEAAGCTSEVDESVYHDFTTYFFGALSGTDRLGHPVNGADYNHDGHVGMNEAYAYALIHDISIDTPVATSDVYLRHYVKTPDDTIFQTPYSQILPWATPAQRAALQSLSTQLKLTGEARLATAHRIFQDRLDTDDSDDEFEEEVSAHWIRFVRLAKSVVLAHTLMSGDDEAAKSGYVHLTEEEAGNPF